MYQLEFKNICKTFDHKSISALNSVNLVLNSDPLAIMGPSGTGKSTLLKIMSGLVKPDSGEVYLNEGQGAKRITFEELKKWVSYLPQALEISNERTIFEHIHAACAPENDDTYYYTRELIDLFSLHYKDDQYPNQLSFGQLQRLAFAIALASRPKWILLDEPFAHLDLMLEKELKIELAQVFEQLGVTPVLVTHAFKDVLDNSSKLYLLHYGQIYQSGDPLDLYLQPKDSFVARFFGPSNLIPVSIVLEDAGRAQVFSENLDFGASVYPMTYNQSAASEFAFAFFRPEALDILPESKAEVGIGAKVQKVSIGENGNLVEVSLLSKNNQIKLYAYDRFRQIRKDQKVRMQIRLDQVRIISS